MFKKLSFRQKLFIYISVLFTIFTVLVLFFQFEREKDFKRKQLESSLYNATELTHKFILMNGLLEKDDLEMLDSLNVLIPMRNVRITVIDPKGKVIYDSEVQEVEKMENHLYRQEVQKSIVESFGSNIRKSATTGNSYYYYSKFHTNYFVRAATLYNIEIKNFLRAEKLFIIYLVFLFLFTWAILWIITKNLGDTIQKLKDFVIKLSLGEEIQEPISFSNDELGTISSQIVLVYNKLSIAKNEISIEKNKLFSHLHALNEGIAFFSSEKKKILTNNHFIQYLNVISEKSTISAEKIFEVTEYIPIVQFVDKQLNKQKIIDRENLPQIEINIVKDGKYFNVQCIIFQDKSFEIVIKDITKLEKRKLIKQQMTSNIAHELKTPVATVMGYLETLLENDIDKKTQKHFINRAFNQAKRLSDLIEDISTLNKIEEAGGHFSFEQVNISTVVNEVHENLMFRLEKSSIKLHNKLEKKTVINGNRSLLFSVFYNLIDNAIKYGGENIELDLNNYLEDNEFQYFSFSNTGDEIEESHLPRIFERFYRIDTGRSRKAGGTGLGLAIVKNAVELHGGEITARNQKYGGVEFLFSFAK